MNLHPNVWLGIAVTAGALTGLGLYLLVLQFVPATPALGPALRRLHPAAIPVAEPAMIRQTRSSWTAMFRVPVADLDILGRTSESHLLNVGLATGTGFILPILVSVIFVAAGIGVPIIFPVGGTIVLSVLMGIVVHLNMVTSAKAARAEFVRALCTYASLTAHQVRSGHGAVEAMEQSARICDGWPYVRLRTALLSAQLQMRTPWEELKTLAGQIQVIELADFADIMRSAGTDGAQVYQTLRAQASSLRDQIRARAIESAKTRTSKLDIPSTMLILILLVLVIYPLLINMFNQG